MSSLKIAVFSLLPAMLLAIVAVLSFVLWPKYQAVRFVQHWSATFRKCPDFESLASLSPRDRPDLVYVRRFGNGEWVVARMEHACCSGAGYNATVFYDSAKAIRYDTTYSFCGYEGLCGELDEIKASNLPGFYRQITFLNLKTKSP